MKNIAISKCWKALFKDPDQKQVNSFWKDIHSHYSEPHRAYHNIEHLEHILGLIELQDLKLEDRETLIHATVFHDVIYQPGSTKNEKESAEYAETALQNLKQPKAMVEKVTRIILATANHQSTDPLTQLFLDMDMAILGTTPQAYQKYRNAIRQEHQNILGILYNIGRRKFLKNTLKQERIFQTLEFFSSYEQKSRINIQNEIHTLSLNKMRLYLPF